MVKVQQRGLGKGLSALISENYTQPAAASAESAVREPAVGSAAVKIPSSEMPVSRLVPGKFQPRHRFNDEQLRELADSIEKNGIMQPIIVRQVTRAGQQVYEIVAGERRWRAASLAGLQSVPVIVRDITDQQALELAIIENVQRADLTPLEEAGGYQRLLEEFGHTQEELARIVGKSRSHITNLLRLLALPEDIKVLLDENKLSMGHARALLNAPNASDIARQVVEKGLSVRQAESLARSSQGLEKTNRPRAPRAPQAGVGTASDANKDPDILVLEETLSENLGMRVTINDRGQTGEIVIGYESLTQLDELLRKLGGSF